MRHGGGQGEDVVTLTEYDLTGNVSHQWLPIGVQGGGTAMDYASFKQAAYGLYGSDQRPYTMTVYDDRMESRPVGVHRPGKEYRNRAVTTDYSITSGQVSTCLRFRVVSSKAGAALECAGTYSPGTLRCETTTDEDGNQTEVFRDRSERIVLERRYPSGEVSSDTYRVYDRRGLLRYIVSPEAVRLVSPGAMVEDSIISKLCFRYDYDVGKRLISEQIPGAAPIYYVYDKLGNKIFSQDGNQRTRSEWSVFKYDSRHRLAIEGRCKMAGATRESLQTQYGNRLLTETKSIDSSNEYRLLYTNNEGPSGFEALRSYVYDDYSHWTGFISQQPANTYLQTEMSRSALGLLTGGAVNDEGNIYHQAIVYDPYGRVIAECERECFLNAAGYARYYTYNYRGILTHKKTEYQSYGERMLLDSHCVEWRYSHDSGDRVTKIEYSIDGGQWHEQSTQTYDCIGRPVSKTLGEVNIGAITYSHDPQGRLTSLTSPWYSQRLHYTTNPFDPAAPISYNGNITSSHDTMWETINGTTTQSALKFSHIYDGMSRLTRSYDNHGSGRFMEEMDYDLNGNIMGILRDYDGDRVQDLAIVRDGNRIVSVYDVSDDSRIGEVPQIPSGDYTGAVDYDANGNITRDATRNITRITYHDYLNLPKIITVNGKSNIHRYRPDGVKTQDRETRTVMTTVTSVDSTGNTVTTLKPTNTTTLRQYTGDFINTGAQTWEVPTEDGHLSIDYRNNVTTHRKWRQCGSE